MTISAKTIADSISPAGARLTTMELRYPRFIHAEVMTHRAFSRNASSSRAIPIERLIRDVLEDPAMPVHWGRNQSGMQARQEHDAPIVFRNDAVSAEAAWLRARDVAVDAAERFSKAGYHKQVVNRLLEPFAHINVVVTATDWGNFFKLRAHPDAQPEIQDLALRMRDAMDGSLPAYMAEHEWHLPYVDTRAQPWAELKQVSAARCARVSYKTHDGRVPDFAEDLGLYERLAAGRPKHLSPLEHQATPAEGRHANLTGWSQFRHEVE